MKPIMVRQLSLAERRVFNQMFLAMLLRMVILMPIMKKRNQLKTTK